MTLAPFRPPSSLTWPGLHVVPTGPRAVVSARIARRLFTAAVNRLPVTVHLAGVAAPLGRGGPEMTVTARRVLRPHRRDGLIGFGEAYLTGAWDADDLGGFLTVLAAELPRLVPASLQRLRAAYVARPPRHQESSVDNSRNNIGHHYDLSNELFETFLDDTLTYSSALFDTGVAEQGDHHAAVPADPDSGARREDLARRRCARSSGCSTPPGSAPGQRCSRSAPAGVSSRSAPPAGAPRCGR